MEYIYNGSIDDVSEIELALKMCAAELNAVVGRIMDGSDQVLAAASVAKENGREHLGTSTARMQKLIR
nr:hypothetical protein [Enterovibrio nigricans]